MCRRQIAAGRSFELSRRSHSKTVPSHCTIVESQSSRCRAKKPLFRCTKTNQVQDIKSLFAQISKSLSTTRIDDYMQSNALIMKSMMCKFVWLPNYSCQMSEALLRPWTHFISQIMKLMNFDLILIEKSLSIGIVCMLMSGKYLWEQIIFKDWITWKGHWLKFPLNSNKKNCANSSNKLSRIKLFKVKLFRIVVI